MMKNIDRHVVMKDVDTRYQTCSDHECGQSVVVCHASYDLLFVVGFI